ncbi:MAG: response regulator [Pseudomonadales bacterium]|nr:response regulator [Pseudomonadales bacterium]
MDHCRVMLVDDHAVFRETLAVGLNQSGIDVVDQAGSTQECMQKLQDMSIDVLLLDLTMPGRGGADLVLQVARRHPDTAILILSAHPADQFVGRLVKQGASGYLHKSCSLKEVITGIHTVSEGRMVLSPDLAAHVTGESSERLKPHESLSNREYQVMERLVAGVGVSEIAREMNLSVKTISTYRKRLLEKLGVQSNSEIVSYAIRNSLVDV